jgi:hypothetical protein
MAFTHAFRRSSAVSSTLLCLLPSALHSQTTVETSNGAASPSSSRSPASSAPAPQSTAPLARISQLTRQSLATGSNHWVRIQGVVLDQGLGEYVVIQDETGWIRAETRQTTPVGGENVVASGIADWDGNFMYLRETTFHPVAWDAMAEEKIVPAPGRPDELPTLTRSIEVRNLPASQAAWKYPVRIHGVVTTSRTEWKSLFVQDDTAGILVGQGGSGRGEWPWWICAGD